MRVTDRGAVRQNECGHKASRIDSAVGIGVLLALARLTGTKGTVSPFSAMKKRTRREFGDAAE